MRPIELPKGKAVYVRWVDSVTQTGWNYDGSGCDAPEVVESLAFVVTSSQKCLALSTSLSHRGGIVSALLIPWEAIQEITPVGDAWDRMEKP